MDRTCKDGEKISLGGTELTAHLHAGHTKGATSFTLDVRENNKAYRVIIANMGSINPGVKVTGIPGLSVDWGRLREDVPLAEGDEDRRLALLARVAVQHA